MSENLKQLFTYLMPSGLLLLVNKTKRKQDVTISFPEELRVTSREIKIKVFNQLEEINQDSEYTHSFPKEELEELWAELDDEQNQFESVALRFEADYSPESLSIINTYEEVKDDIDQIVKGDMTLEDVIDYYRMDIVEEHGDHSVGERDLHMDRIH